MLQPKNIKKQRGKVVRNFTWGDSALAVILLFLSLTIGYSVIPRNIKLYKVYSFGLSILVFVLFSLVLIKSNKYNCRIYILFFRMLKFCFRVKKFGIKNKKEKVINDTNLLIPYRDLIDGKIIQTKTLKSGTKYFSVIKFKGKSPWGEDSGDKDAFIKRWNDILDTTETHLSIVRTKELMDYSQNFDNLQENMNLKMKKLKEKEVDKGVVGNYMTYYEERYKDFENLDLNLLFDTYYLVIYAKKTVDLNKAIINIFNSLNSLDAEPMIISDMELIKFLAKINYKEIDEELALNYLKQKNLGNNKLSGFRKTNEDEYNENIDLIWKIKSWWIERFGRKNKKDKKIEKDSSSIITLDQILKSEKVIFKSKYFIKDNKYYSIQTVSDLPINLEENWTNTLLSNDSLVVWQLSPWSEDNQASLLDNTNKKVSDNADMTKSRYNRKNNSLQLEALDYLENQLQVNGNLLFNSSFMIINEASTLKELKKIEQKNYYEAHKYKINLNPLPFKQFEAYSQSCLITTNNLNEDIQMSSENIAYGWGFENEINNDGNSFILGETFSTGEPIIFNQFYKKSSRRSNYNMFTVGSSGKGKSTDVKKSVIGHLAENNKVYIIDPQNEYKKLGNMFGATNIDLGVGYKTVINPLEIQVLLNDEDEDYTFNLIINKHLEWLEQFFKLIHTDFNNEHIITLIKCVKELYEEKGIYEIKEIDKLKEVEFPIVSDLIQKLKNYQYVDDFEKARKQLLVVGLCETMEYLFEHNGKYQALYNGKTNINLDNDFIIFNTQKLSNDDTNSSKVGLFILLSFLQNKVFSNYLVDKNSNTIIVIDELHMYIDPNNMTTLNFVYTMTKTVRKFNAGMLLCTQNPSDFLGSSIITLKAQAILQNCQYSKFFGLKQKDLEAVVEMYKTSGGLNVSQTKYLADSEIGNLLFSLHMYSKTKANIYYNEFEEDMFFTKGRIGANWMGTNE